MKKKFFTSIAVTFVMAAALVAVAPTSAQAAKAINVTVGAKVTVKANKKVTWSVKDTSIATINKKSGKKVKLTGVKEGSTVLTTTDASGKTLDYAVNVKAAAAPAATNKLQEFANYVKSKNGLTYKGSVSVLNNWEKLKGSSCSSGSCLNFCMLIFSNQLCKDTGYSPCIMLHQDKDIHTFRNAKERPFIIAEQIHSVVGQNTDMTS